MGATEGCVTIILRIAGVSNGTANYPANRPKRALPSWYLSSIAAAWGPMSMGMILARTAHNCTKRGVSIGAVPI
jgi:hypothetical protein